jgi:hypothetical protein
MKLEVWISTLAPLLAEMAPPYKLHVPRRDMEKSQEISVDHHTSTYPEGAVALESAGVDLNICIPCINCTALRVVGCPPPEIGAESIFRTSFFLGREVDLRSRQYSR